MNNILTEQFDSMVTHETRILEVPGSNPEADQPGWGFLNFIIKEFVIFQGQIQMSGWSPCSTAIDRLQFNVPRDLKSLLWKMMDFCTVKFPNR